ncbi:unnamed protein product, partial [Durusdinium trenchii]
DTLCHSVHGCLWRAFGGTNFVVSSTSLGSTGNLRLTCGGDHYWTAKNVSYFDTYVTEAASMGTRRLYFSLMRFCRVLGHCNKRFKHVSEQLWTGHTPAAKLSQSALGVCLRGIQAFKVRKNYFTEKLAEDAWGMITEALQSYQSHLRSIVDILQQRKGFNVAVWLQASIAVAAALRDYGTSVFEMARLRQIYQLPPWPWVFHARPGTMRWHVLQQLIIDYHMPKPRVVELGVERGILSEELLKVPTLSLLGIDPYIYNNEFYSSSHRFDAQPHYDAAALVPGVRADARAARLYVGTSREAAEDDTLKGEWSSIDLLFIDADHKMMSVLEDLNLWYSRVRPGGLIAGHDFAVAHDGVQRAVIHWKPVGRVLHLSHDDVWWFEKSDADFNQSRSKRRQKGAVGRDVTKAAVVVQLFQVGYF